MGSFLTNYDIRYRGAPEPKCMLNSLIGGEELVERSGGGHLHDQHQMLSIAQTQHANDEGVAQLVHDLRLPHHLLPHQLLVFILQDFDGHINLAPEGKQAKSVRDERLPLEASLVKLQYS